MDCGDRWLLRWCKKTSNTPVPRFCGFASIVFDTIDLIDWLFDWLQSDSWKRKRTAKKLKKSSKSVVSGAIRKLILRNRNMIWKAGSLAFSNKRGVLMYSFYAFLWIKRNYTALTYAKLLSSRFEIYKCMFPECTSSNKQLY